jgi:hypothetical protein
MTELPERRVVGGEVMFEGNLANETSSTFTPANSPSYTGKSYWKVTGPAELTDYGSTSELVTAAVQSFSKSVYTPALVTSLAMAPGETRTVSYTIVTTTTINGVAQAPLAISAVTIGTFVGFEQITIPAGTFDACRFDQKHQGPNGPTSTHWFLVGHGVELKSSTPAFAGAGASVTELASLLIDGSVPR